MTCCADLHIHTTASDGTYSPDDIVATAIGARISTISITDHDTMDGYLDAIQILTGELTVIPGIEFSTDLPCHEVHILGYHINPNHPELQAVLQTLADDRSSRTARIVSRLHQLGYHVSLDLVHDLAGTASVLGRPHVARALVASGYASSVKDAFQRLLDKNGPAYVPHYKLTPGEVVSLIHRSGGLAVLAHPGLIGDDTLAQELLDLRIDGIEAIHPAHSQLQISQYEQLAKRRGLLVTGGSDFHGLPGRFPDSLGLFTVPQRLADSLGETARRPGMK